MSDDRASAGARGARRRPPCRPPLSRGLALAASVSLGFSSVLLRAPPQSFTSPPAAALACFPPVPLPAAHRAPDA